MTCERCTRPARHRLTVGDDQLTDVCCGHADEVMFAVGQMAGEGERGWAMWQDAHAEMCGSEA